MTETSNLLTWDPEILLQLKKCIEVEIKDVSSSISNRENEMLKAEEASRSLMAQWEMQIDYDTKRLENMIQAKAAVVGALRIIKKDSRPLMN